jgi:hypothetical protein
MENHHPGFVAALAGKLSDQFLRQREIKVSGQHAAVSRGSNWRQEFRSFPRTQSTNGDALSPW